MGDGQHGWAAAEWVMIIRNSYVREEGERLIFGSGLLARWLGGGEEVSFGPTLTPWGKVTIRGNRREGAPGIMIEAHWRTDPPSIDVDVPGFGRVTDAATGTWVQLEAAEPPESSPSQHAFAEGV